MKTTGFRLAVFCCLLVFYSCNKDESDPYHYNDPTIYSESNQILLSEIIFFMQPYITDSGQKKYIATDRLKNISLKINDRIEQVSDSYPLDTAHLNFMEIHGNYWVTSQLIHYPAVMNVTMIPDALTTAGQYADLLNNYMNLLPGIYVCRIVSFDIATVSGELETVYTPSLSFSLEVKDNMGSIYLGEFEVEIK
jgi:hypothetical protein